MSGIQDALGALVIKRLEAKNDDVVAVTQAVISELNTTNALNTAKASSTLAENHEARLAALTKRGVKTSDPEWQDALKEYKRWTEIIMDLVAR